LGKRSTTPASHQANPPPGRIVTVDLLRGLAILWVIVFHLWIDINLIALPPADYYHIAWDRVMAGEWGSVGTALIDAIARIGFQGVPVFMMLSGLALYMSAARSGGTGPLLPYYFARLRRLLVPYWAGFAVFFLAVCSIALLRVWVDGGSFGDQYHNGVTVSAYHVIDISWSDALVSLAVMTRVLRDEWFSAYPDSLWFVAVLVQYYLLFPFLRSLLDRIGPGWFIAGALVVTVVSKGLLIATLGGLLQGSAFRFDGGVAPFRIYDFALGMTLGYLLVHRRASVEEYATSAFDVAGLVVLGLLLQIGGTLIDDRQAYFNAIGAPMVISGLTLLTLPLIAKRPGRFEAATMARLLAWIGTISYAVLIMNEPLRLLASLLRIEGIGDGAMWWCFLVAIYVPASVLAAWPFAVATGLIPRPQFARNRGDARG
jgi:peptidoglycan/LPS O-acetylase OafA/YrhL